MKRPYMIGFWSLVLIILLGLAALPVVWTPAVQAQDFTVPTRTPTPGPATPVPPPTDTPPTDPSPTDPPPVNPTPGDPPPTGDSPPPATITPTPGAGTPGAGTPEPGTTETVVPGTGTPAPEGTGEAPLPPGTATTPVSPVAPDGNGVGAATATPSTAQDATPAATASLDDPPLSDQGEPAPFTPTPTMVVPMGEIGQDVRQQFPLLLCGGALLLLVGIVVLFIWRSEG